MEVVHSMYLEYFAPSATDVAESPGSRVSYGFNRGDSFAMS